MAMGIYTAGHNEPAATSAHSHAARAGSRATRHHRLAGLRLRTLRQAEG